MKLLKYIQGKRQGKEAHRIEKEAMRDPFLSDALEGFDSIQDDHIQTIIVLQKKINQTTHKKPSNRWKWSMAASLLLLLSVGLYFLVELPVDTDILSYQQTEETLTPGQSIDVSPTLPKEKVEIEEKQIAILPPKQEEISRPEIAIVTPPQPPVSKEAIPLVESVELAQTSTKERIRGQVTDENGEPLAGANIQIKGTSQSTFTDLDGNFELDAAFGEELYISYLGYESENIQSDENMIITLREDNHMLDDVIVMGQGAIRQRKVDRATAEQPISEILSGKVAGVSTQAKTGRVRGQVIDEQGEPLIGANVVVKGTTRGAITDIDGTFELDANYGEELYISYIGYESENIQSRENLTIALREDRQTLDEVIVVGYGTSARKSVTGSVSSLKSKLFRKRPKPVDGKKAYKEYIAEDIEYPEDDICKDKQGVVKLSFYVNHYGRPYNIEVIKSLCEEADEEAIRLIEDGPEWTIGERKVKIKIKFKNKGKE